MFLAPDPDLSGDFYSDDDEDDEDKEEEEEQKEEEDDGKWFWCVGDGPAPFFDSSTPEDGKPISRPLRAADMTPLKFFYQMLPKPFISKVVVQPNKYAAQKLEAATPERKGKWREVDEADIFRFSAITICMGIVRARRKRDFWFGTSAEVIKFPSVAHVLSILDSWI